MPEHIVDSQPKHPDAGMDALIRHFEGTPEGVNDAGGEGEEEAEPIAAEAAEAEEAETVKVEVEEGEAEAEPAAEFDEDPLIPVMVQGVEEQVALSELMRGYNRQSDYTRKTQALAEERKALESERSQLMLATQESVQRVASLADQLQAQIQSSQPDPAELDQLRLTNPAEYAARVADQQRNRALLMQAQQHQAALEHQERVAKVQKERSALTDADADFASDFDGAYNALGRWITSPEGGGFSPEEWNGEYDHRRILLARDAMRWREHVAATTAQTSTVRKKVANLPRVRPVARQAPGQTAKANAAAAIERMQSTNTNRDAAKALEAWMAAKKTGRGSDGYP